MLYVPSSALSISCNIVSEVQLHAFMLADAMEKKRCDETLYLNAFYHFYLNLCINPRTLSFQDLHK